MPNWFDITRNPEYQNLPEQDRIDVKRKFFDATIGKEKDFLDLDDNAKRATWIDFMNSPDDSGQGYTTSLLGAAGRGFGEVVPGAIQGVGALTGITPLEEAGKYIRGGLESLAPVNPIYQEGIGPKLANVAGNIGSLVATGGVGGAAGKALAAERIAAGANAAERAALATQAITRGVNTALYGTTTAQGAASGAQAADQYGMTGANRYANILSHAASELVPELLPVVRVVDTVLPKRLLGAATEIPGIRRSALTEGLEEGATQIGQNAATKTFAPAGVETPGVLENVPEAMGLGAFGGSLLGAAGKLAPTPGISEAQAAVASSADTGPAKVVTDAIVAQNADLAAQAKNAVEGLRKQAAAQVAQRTPVQAETQQEAPVEEAPAALLEQAPSPVSEAFPFPFPQAATQENNAESLIRDAAAVNAGAQAGANPQTGFIPQSNEPNLQKALPEVESGEQIVPQSRQLPTLSEQPAAQAQEEGAGGAGIQPQPIENQDHATQQNTLESAVRDNRPVSAAAVDSYGIKLPEGYTRQGELYVYNPKTAPAATNETAAPSAKGTAAAIASSSLEGGRSSELPKESPQTAIESTEKSLETPVAERSADDIIKALDAMAAFPGKTKDRHNAVVAEVKRLPKAKIAEIANALGTKPDAESIAADVMSQPQVVSNQGLEKVYTELNEEEAEKTGRDLVEGRESRKDIINSLTSKDESLPDEDQRRITVNDVAHVQRLIGKDVPGAALANVITSRDFLAQVDQWTDQERDYWNGLIGAVRSGKTEGAFIDDNGMIFIFPDLISLRQSDQRVAAQLGISPSEAAARRVLIHESFVHYGFSGLAAEDQNWLANWARKNTSSEQMAATMVAYPRRKNESEEAHLFRVLEERLAQIVEKTGKWPADHLNGGMWKQLKAFLARIWSKITGKNEKEAVPEDLLKVFKMLRAGGQNIAAIDNSKTAFGGEAAVKFSSVPPNYFTQAVNINGRVETGTTHYEAWLKHVMRQLPAYQKDGLNEEQRRELADKWLVEHPDFISNSLDKEGFATPEGFMDRKKAYKKFVAMGGNPSLYPGEVRDWLDSSDVDSTNFKASYANDTRKTQAPIASILRGSPVGGGVDTGGITPEQGARLADDIIWNLLGQRHVERGGKRISGGESDIHRGDFALTASALSFAKSFLSKNGVSAKIASDTESPLAVSTDQDGNISLLVNPELIKESILKQGSVQDAERFYEASLFEEVIHIADDLGMRQEWENAGKNGSFYEFVAASHKKTLDQIQDIIDSSPNPKLTEGFISDIVANLGSMYQGQPFNLYEVKNLAEMVRQIAQYDLTGEITELRAYKSFADHMARVLQRIIGYLRSTPQSLLGAEFISRVETAKRIVLEAKNRHSNSSNFKASYAQPYEENAAKLAQNLSGEHGDDVRRAYERLADKGATIPLSRLLAESGLSKDEFKRQMQALFNNGQAMLYPANTFEQQEKDMEAYGVFGHNAQPASFAAILPEPNVKQQYDKPSSILLRPYSASTPSGAGVAAIPASDNSPRAQAIRKAVSESNWNELSTTERAKALEEFGLKSISSRYSFDAALLPVRVTNERTPENRPASVLASEPSPAIAIQFDASGLSDLLFGDAVTAFAAAYDMAQEEVIHTAQHINIYKQWRESGSTEPLGVYELRHYTGLINEMVDAAKDGLRDGDARAASILVNTWNLYNPNNVAKDMADVIGKLPKAANAAQFAMEIGRQLIQFKRQDFTTETGWMQFKAAMAKYMSDVLNALKTALSLAVDGKAGQMLKNEIEQVGKVMDALESKSDAILPEPEPGVKFSMAQSQNDAEYLAAPRSNAGGETTPIKPSADFIAKIAEVLNKKKADWQGKMAFDNNIDPKHDRASQKTFEELGVVSREAIKAIHDSGIPVEDITAVITAPSFINALTDSENGRIILTDIMREESMSMLNDAALEAEKKGDLKRAVDLQNQFDAYASASSTESSAASARMQNRKWIYRNAKYLVRRVINKLRNVSRDRLKKAVNAPGASDAIDTVNRGVEAAEEQSAERAEDATKAAEAMSDEVLFEETLSDKQKGTWATIKRRIAKIGEMMRALAGMGENFKASNAADNGDYSKMTADELRAAIAKEVDAVFEDLETIFPSSTPKTKGKRKTPKDLQEAVESLPKEAQNALKAAEFQSKLFAGDKEAVEKLSRLLSKMRPANARPGKGPLSAAIPWKKLLEMRAANQEQIKQNMLDALKDNPLLEGVSEADMEKVADIVSGIWQKHRDKLIKNELKTLTDRHDFTKKLNAALNKPEVRAQLFKLVSAGALNNDTFYEALAKEYGFRNLTADERQRVQDIVNQMEDPDVQANRAKMVLLEGELTKTMANMGDISRIDVIRSLWYSSVLSSPRTLLAMMGGSVHAIFHTAAASVQQMLTHPSNFAENATRVKDAWMLMAKHLPTQIRGAMQYVATGDSIYLDKSDSPVSAILKERLNNGAGAYSIQIGERLMKEGKTPFTKGIGWFIAHMSRLILAIDAVTGQMAKMAAIPLQIRGKYSSSEVHKLTDLQPYMDSLIKSGVPADSKELRAMAYQNMMQGLEKLESGLEDATNYMKTLANLNVDPRGVGGALHGVIKNSAQWLERKAKQKEADLKHWLEHIESETGDSFGKDVVKTLGPLGVAIIKFVASMAMPAAGFGFVRVAGNLLNLSLSYIPGLGLTRLLESHDSKQQMAHYNTILRNQVIGLASIAAIIAMLRAIEDEPDDKKRGWFFEGDWGGLTPQQKAANYAAGRYPNTFGRVGKDGVRHGFSFSDLPVAGPLQMLSNLSDTIKYHPDNWKEAGSLERMARGVWAMGTATSNIAALSQFADIMGTSRSSEDPYEAMSRRVPKVVGNFAAGFIPAALKDVDYWTDSRQNRYKGMESLFENVPFARRWAGSEYLDVFGKQIEKSRTPWSRVYKEGPSEPEYLLLDDLATKGIWLSPANPANRLVGKGRNKREMTPAEGAEYQKLVGNGYRDFVLQYGPRLVRMQDEQAKQFVTRKTDDIRERAARQVYQGSLQ